MTKELAKQIVTKVINDNGFSNSMFNAYDRYADEGKYEDWKDYDKFIKAAWAKLDTKGKVIKTCKRPFGLVVDFGVIKWKVFVKVSGRRISLYGKTVA